MQGGGEGRFLKTKLCDSWVFYLVKGNVAQNSPKIGQIWSNQHSLNIVHAQGSRLRLTRSQSPPSAICLVIHLENTFESLACPRHWEGKLVWNLESFHKAFILAEGTDNELVTGSSLSLLWEHKPAVCWPRSLAATEQINKWTNDAKEKRGLWN